MLLGLPYTFWIYLAFSDHCEAGGNLRRHQEISSFFFGARNNLCLNAAASSLLNGASVMKKYENLERLNVVLPHYNSSIVVGMKLLPPTLTIWLMIQRKIYLVRYQRFGDLFLFGLVWQYPKNQNQYDKGRLKVMATYLQHWYNLHTLFLLCRKS